MPTGKLWNLTFSLTLESRPSNISFSLSPYISSELIAEDSFPRCAKSNYDDGKSVRSEGRAQSGSNSSPYERGCLISSAKAFLSTTKYDAHDLTLVFS